MCLMYPGTDDLASKLDKPFYDLKFWPNIKERPLLTFVIAIHHSSPQSDSILSGYSYLVSLGPDFKCPFKPARSFGNICSEMDHQGT